MSSRATKEQAVEALAAWRRITSAHSYAEGESPSQDAATLTGFLERVGAALPTAVTLLRCAERRKTRQ